MENNLSALRLRTSFAFFLILATAAAFTGCKTDYGWRTVALDTPWMTPNIQATQREHSYAYYMDAGRRTDRYWGSEMRHGSNLATIRKHFDAYIVNSGWLSEWKATGSSIGSITQRLPPYRFTIVSINPSIVVATPLDLSSVTNYWDVPPLVDRPPLQRIHTDYLLTPLEFGTTLPSADRFTFINLATSERQTILAPHPASGFHYSTSGCRLFCFSSNNVWQVKRMHPQ